MTDNEIVKALENEVKSTEYVDSEYCDGVDLTLIKSAVDLINRQQAENINLKGHLEQLKSRYDNAKSEIKRLKGISVSPSKDSMDFCGVLCDYAEELIDKAKSEAYKEFAERLKLETIVKSRLCVKEYDIGYNDGYSEAYYNFHNTIDELLNEYENEN